VNSQQALFSENPEFFTDFFERWHEESYRSYLNWAPNDNIALSLSYRMEKFTTNLESLDSFRNNFPDTFTHIGSTSARYFNNNGLFFQVEPILVHQNVVGTDINTTQIAKLSETFFLLGTSVGYRLPNRLGVIKFQVKNLLDQQFIYQNEWFRSNNRELNPQFYPERTFFGSVFINF